MAAENTRIRSFISLSAALGALVAAAGPAHALDFASAHDAGGTWADVLGQSFSPGVAPMPDPGSPGTVELTGFSFFRGGDGSFGEAPGSASTRLVIVEGSFPDLDNLNIVGISTNTVDVTAADTSGGLLPFDFFGGLELDYSSNYSALLFEVDMNGDLVAPVLTSVLSTDFADNGSGTFLPTSEYGGTSFDYSALFEQDGSTFVAASDATDARFIAEFESLSENQFVSAHEEGLTFVDSLGQSFSPSVAPMPAPGTPETVFLERFSFFRGDDGTEGGAAGSANTRLVIVQGSFPNLTALDVVGFSSNTVDVTAVNANGGEIEFLFDSLELDFDSNYAALLVQTDANDNLIDLGTASLLSTDFVDDGTGTFIPQSEYGGTSFNYGQLFLPDGETFVFASDVVDTRFVALFSSSGEQSYTITTRPDFDDIFETIGDRSDTNGQSFVPSIGAPSELMLDAGDTVLLSSMTFFAGTFLGTPDEIASFQGDANTRLAIVDRGPRVIGEEGNVQARLDEMGMELPNFIQIDNANAALFNFFEYGMSGSFGTFAASEIVAISNNAIDTLDNGSGQPNGYGTPYVFDFDSIPLDAGNAYEAVFVTVSGPSGSEVLTIDPVTIAFAEFDDVNQEVPLGGPNDFNVTGLFDGNVFFDGTLRGTDLGFDAAFDATFIIESCPGDFDGSGAVDFADAIEFLSLVAAGDLAADLDSNGSLDAADVTIGITAIENGCP